MAKKAFNLGDYLKSEGPVSTLDTEQIVRIPLDQIDPNPDNFYSLEGLEDLAANIELVGLLDALRVRPENGRYIVVSGHRRRAACMMIRDGGNPMFDAGIPCIVEYGEASPAMRELRLIYANAATRVMSAADLSKQAERVTQLLYELKEQGVEFPGRMRDHVAQACQVSASKIARLHAIRSNLRDSYRLFFDAGELSEGSAYRLSQETPEIQKEIWTRLGAAVNGLSGEKLEAVIEQVKKPRPEPVSKMDTPAEESPASYDADEYLAERAREDGQYFSMLQYHAARLIRDLAAESPEWQLGRQRQDGIEALKKQNRHHGTGGMKVDLQGSPKGLELYSAKKRLRIQRTWTDVYDMLCITALQLAAQVGREKDGEKEDPSTRPAASVGMTGVAWQTGTPERNGRYYCRIRFADSPEDGGRVHEQRGEWRDGGWWFFGEPEKYGIQVVGWWPLPDEERWK